MQLVCLKSKDPARTGGAFFVAADDSWRFAGYWLLMETRDSKPVVVAEG
jgi:hypothetical protein